MRSSFRLIRLSPLFLGVACAPGADSGEETAAEPAVVVPLEGKWEFYGTSFDPDDCNAVENLSEPTAFINSDVDEDSFLVKVYDTGTLVGQEVACDRQGHATYLCEDISQSWPQTSASSIQLTGTYTMSFDDESSAWGSAAIVLDCVGTDCATVAGETNSGSFPCDSVQTWSAGFVE